jgi:alkylation response protein AidB-like acyl-CoA dehydrogenase
LPSAYPTVHRYDERRSAESTFAAGEEAAKRVVDLAMEVSGGSGMFRSSELERLYRDVRCGGFHPANTALAHEIVGKTGLGVLAEPQRW